MINLKYITVVLVLLFSSCAVHPNAALRRRLSGRLTSCLREANGNDLWRKQCVKESVTYCWENKLEASCAYDDLITNLPKDRP